MWNWGSTEKLNALLAKREFLGCSIEVIRIKRIARNLLSTEKEEWEEGVVENGKDAGWRGLHFLVDDVSIPGNSPQYARNHFCAVRSLASSLPTGWSIFFISCFLAKCCTADVNRVKENKELFPSSLPLLSCTFQDPYIENKQKQIIYYRIRVFKKSSVNWQIVNTNKAFRNIFINPISFREIRSPR